jgi:hypothetical protein
MQVWTNLSTDGVNTLDSVGQLIPFLIGIGSFLTLFLEWGETLSPEEEVYPHVMTVPAIGRLAKRRIPHS